MRYSNRPKRIVRLTESDLTRVIRRVIRESALPRDYTKILEDTITVSVDGDESFVDEIFLKKDGDFATGLYIELNDGIYEKDEELQINIPNFKYKKGKWVLPSGYNGESGNLGPNNTGKISIRMDDLSEIAKTSYAIVYEGADVNQNGKFFIKIFSNSKIRFEEDFE